MWSDHVRAIKNLVVLHFSTVESCPATLVWIRKSLEAIQLFLTQPTTTILGLLTCSSSLTTTTLCHWTTPVGPHISCYSPEPVYNDAITSPPYHDPGCYSTQSVGDANSDEDCVEIQVRWPYYVIYYSTNWFVCVCTYVCVCDIHVWCVSWPWSLVIIFMCNVTCTHRDLYNMKLCVH